MTLLWPGSGILASAAEPAWCLSFPQSPSGTLRFWNRKQSRLVRHILRLGIGCGCHLSTGFSPGWSVGSHTLPHSIQQELRNLWLQHRCRVVAFALLTSPNQYHRGGQSKQGPEQRARKSRTKEGFYFLCLYKNQLFPFVGR